MKYEDIIDREDNALGKVSEDITFAYQGAENQLDAIWESIVSQTSEVQNILLARLTKLCSSVKPYTYQELNSRIDESERQMESGETISGEQVHEEMRNYLKSLTA